jgi:23S rRNA pseudouridine1911/1915/1917 synthase
VVKRAGELTQGDSTGDESLLDMAKSYIGEKYSKPGEVYLGLVHRLDRPVSGVILFARTSKAAARLSEQFRNRTTEKIYLAAVENSPPQAEGRLSHYLKGDEHRMKVSVSQNETPGAKKAELIYRLLEKKGNRSLLEVRLLTGYKHQIRAQLSYIRCPVIGDFKYDKRQKPAVTERLAEGRAIALHARSLTIIHPTLKEPMTFRAGLPDYWPL